MVLIKVLTFNVDSDGKIKHNLTEMQNAFNNFIKEKLSDDSILFISFQEDKSTPVLLTEDFKNFLMIEGYKVIVNSKGISHFHIHSIIITKLNYDTLTVETKRLNWKNTKNYIVNHITFNNYNISFISTHFPIDTSDKDKLNLGYSIRAKILDDILIKFVKNNNIVVLAGDLNFRINMDGIEQLTQFINQKKSEYNISEIFDINKFGPTCKIDPEPQIKGSEICQNHFNNRQFEPTQLKCNKNKQTDIETCECGTLQCSHAINCYDKKYKRIPSYCDRVLTIQKQQNKIYDVTIVNSEIAGTIDKFSDHNAVYVEFQININDNDNDDNDNDNDNDNDTYVQKYLKYKQKYLKLKHINLL